MSTLEDKEIVGVQKIPDNLPSTNVGENKDNEVNTKSDVKPPVTQNKSIINKKPIQRKKSNSGIPLPLKSSSIVKTPKTSTYKPRPGSTPNAIDKHTLEIQFNNTKKRLTQMQEELTSKQQPMLDLYKNLLSKKEKLEKMGKMVQLGEMKLMTYTGQNIEEKTPALQPQSKGESKPSINPEHSDHELMSNLNDSLKKLMESLMEVYNKFHTKIVDTLEKLPKPDGTASIDFDVDIVKYEGLQLKQSFESMIEENEKKIMDLINDYLVLLNNSNSEKLKSKIQSLENKIKQQEDIISKKAKALENINKERVDKQTNNDKLVVELQAKINKMEEEIKKEKKLAVDNGTKNMTSIQIIKQLKSQVSDLEKSKTDKEKTFSETSSKLKFLQEQLRKKETQWNKEKSEKELIIQKLSEDNKKMDLRLTELQDKFDKHEKDYQDKIQKNKADSDIKDNKIKELEKQKSEFSEQNLTLENDIKELKNINFNISSQNIYVKQYRQKVEEYEDKVKEQTEQLNKMDASISAQSRLIAVLKLGEENTKKQVDKLKESLRNAKNDIELKTKDIYELHEKLMSRESAYNELKKQIKKLRNNLGPHSFVRDKVYNQNADFQSLCETDSDSILSNYKLSKVGKLNYRPLQKSNTIMDFSINKVNYIGTKGHNLKKSQLVNSNCSSSIFLKHNVFSIGDKRKIENLIMLKTRLYQNFQKHADESYEDDKLYVGEKGSMKQK